MDALWCCIPRCICLLLEGNFSLKRQEVAAWASHDGFKIGRHESLEHTGIA
jgi:hypothetical protein